MKKYSLLLVCLALSFVAMSQKAVISFNDKNHDFGKVNEEDGKITYVFNFVNKGNSPLAVSRVQASCGCTTPTWTKEPIEPGKKGTITVTYNPTGRPGAFTKNITVYSNATEEQVTLTIKGEVIPKLTGENSPYPINVNGLALKAKVIQLNNVEKGRIQTRILDILNSSKSPIKPTIENLPPYLSAVVMPETLNPGGDGRITFTFNSKLCNQWGPVFDEVYLSLNGVKKFSDEFKVQVYGNVIEDFSKMTLDQKRKSPILEMPVRLINFGTLKTDTKKTGKLKVYNKGQNPLEIRRIINNNKELIVSSLKAAILSNRTANINVVLNTKNLSAGDYKNSFTIQTNDPDNSYLIIVISWKVQK
jgi:hypothetical protein